MTIIDKLKSSGRTFIVGIAGDSGSGKTTFANAIRSLLGGDIVSSITLDDYHIYDRSTRRKLGITPLHPEANNLNLIKTHLMLLKKGETIRKPTYNHNTGTFGEWVDFEPTPIIIVEGLHTLYDGLRNYLDFKIFVDPARYVKRKWKINRDVVERGYKREEVLDEIIKRESDYKRYIDFQKIYADVVIKIFPTDLQSSERITYFTDRADLYKVRLILRNLKNLPAEPIKLNIDLSDFVKASEKDFALSFFTDYYYEKKSSFIEIDGMMNVELFSSLLGAIKKEAGGNAWDLGKYVNAIEVAKLLVCWRFLEMIKYELSMIESMEEVG
ncbi:MAG: uridine kinase [Archaeoglobus sp.]|jgi:phosphoribulokinase|nr:MAG: uridine kinase [Archaeoglobus sp.]